jgi:23S rRNA (adenine2030-N6)-methyltransferase
VNYRHVYHAGNFADVLKGAALSLILTHLRVKDRPFWVLDTHAGTGLYDLASEAAMKTAEHAEGIGRLMAAADPPEDLSAYLDVVRAVNGGGALRWYPGSPRLARALLRPGDRLVANELHPEDAALLRRCFLGDPQVRVQALDGYLAWKAFLPPTERRGLVLVDPPFEVPGEFERLAEGLKDAHRRWATGIQALWYPIKDEAPIRAFHASLAASGLRRLLRIELLVRDALDPDRLNGCGMIIANPPYRLAETLAAVLAWLAPVLAQGEGARARVAWLVPE